MPKFDIKRKFYALASTDGENAEIQMYGDVVEKWPTDWWTGEKKEGSYIAQDEFLKDLAAVEGCKNVTIRLNSYGGEGYAPDLYRGRRGHERGKRHHVRLRYGQGQSVLSRDDSQGLVVPVRRL